MRQTSRVLPVLLAVALFTAVVLAGDPWNSKPPEQWSAKDVKAILTESPWAQAIAVPVRWKPIVIVPTEIAVGRVGGPTELSPGQVPISVPRSDAQYLVSWASARVVRAAIHRSAILAGQTPPSEPAGPPPFYVITVVGNDMTPFTSQPTKFGPETLQQRAKLINTKTHVSVAAGTGDLQKNPQGIPTMAVFFFPKKTTDGVDLLGSEETTVEWVFQIYRNVTMRASFQTKKMQWNGAPDL